MQVHLARDAVVTVSVVINLGKIKKDNLCFKRRALEIKFKRKDKAQPWEVGQHVQGGSRVRDAVSQGIVCGRGWCERTDRSPSARLGHGTSRSPLFSRCGIQLQILQSSWGTVFNIFTWNNEIKMSFQITLQILLLHAKALFPIVHVKAK